MCYLRLNACSYNWLLLFQFMLGLYTFQSALLEKNSLEVRLAKVNDLLSKQNNQRDLPGENNQVSMELRSAYHFSFLGFLHVND